MNEEKFIRVLAGSMVLASVALAHFHSGWWLLLTAFVGLNLIQSAITGICPPTLIARKLGWFKGKGSCCGGSDVPAGKGI